MVLHSCIWFADIRVTWQIGVTSMNALGGAGCDDYGVCHRARGFRLEGLYRPKQTFTILRGKLAVRASPGTS